VQDLCFWSARELVQAIGAGEVSAREVMAAHLTRIATINPSINAIVAKLDDEFCLQRADDADRRLARGEVVGPLHGLPWAFKDLEDAVGFPAARGSIVFKDFLPAQDSVLVERLRHAGAIPIGKTNVPEFGMGSHTYNTVYGRTRNPYDTTKSAGGSSGGAAAALAAGLLPLADGSDLGGSLRNPGSFNNVVGLRPSLGLVPTAPAAMPFVGFLVKGPMARSVADAAFLLTVMAGPDPRDPACLPLPVTDFAAHLEIDLSGVRIAWCPDLGSLPLDQRVRTVLEAKRQTFVDLKCQVEDAVPDLSNVDDIFLTLRRLTSAEKYGALLDQHRHEIKPEAVEEIERGMALTAADVTRAMTLHAELLRGMAAFFDRFDIIACAVSQVPPFDVNVDWPRSIAGVEMTSYTDWMKSAYWTSVTLGPAISVPCGFTPEGLPVGIQLIAPPRRDVELLQLAYGFEQATKVGDRHPTVPENRAVIRGPW
jgi:amidase